MEVRNKTASARGQATMLKPMTITKPVASDSVRDRLDRQRVPLQLRLLVTEQLGQLGPQSLQLHG